MAADIEQAVVVRVTTEGTLQITKMADELKKLPQAAQSASAGTAPLGGALSSAGSGADKFSTAVADLRAQLARMGADAAGLRGQAASLATSVSGLGGAFAVVLPVAIGAAAAITAFRFVLGPLAEAAGKAEESQIRLANAVKQAGSTIEDQAGRIGQAAKQMAGTSIFDETSLRNAAALFTTITGDAGAAESALQPIVDLSAALGIGLEDSARMVARAGAGMVGALSRVGIVFTEVEQKQMAAASSSDRLAMVFAKIEEKTGGSASAQLQTYAGSIAQIGKQWDDLKETMGNLGALELAKDFFAGLQLILEGVKATIEGIVAAKRMLSGEGIVDFLTQTPLDAGGEFNATKGKVGGLYAPAGQFNLPGPSGDEVNKGIQTSNELAAALAKVNEQAVSTKQATDALFRDLAKMSVEIEVGIKVPETDPIKKAVGEVSDWASKKLEQIGDKQFDVAGRMAASLAAAASLKAETDRMRTSGTGDPAQIAANQQLLGLIYDQIAGDKQALAILSQMPGKVKETAAAASQLAADNALAEEFAKAREELEKLNAENQKFADDLQKQVSSLPAFLQGGAQAFAAQLDQMRRMAAENPISVFGPVSSDEMDAAMKRLQDGTKRAGDTFFDLMGQSADEFAKKIDQVVADLDAGFKDLSGTLADMFSTIALGGADGLTNALKKAFDSTIHDFTKKLSDGVLTAFGAAPTKTEQELKAMTPEQVTAYEAGVKQQQDLVKAGVAIAGSIGNIVSMFQAAKKGQEVSVVATTVTFAIAGASIGGWIGALAGALVGAVTSLLANAQAKKEQPYAAYGIKDGKAFVEAYPGQERQFENVTNSMRNDMLQRMNAVLESTSSDYIKLLLKFPVKISSALTLGMDSLDFAPVMNQYQKVAKGFWTGLLHLAFGVGASLVLLGTGLAKDYKYVVDPTKPKGTIGDPNFDKAARKSFLSDFDDWVKNTLPHEIAAHFRDQVGSAFVAMGLTIDRFNAMWDALQGMDPKAAMQVMNDTVDALNSFSKLTDFMANVGGQFRLGIERYQEPLTQTGMERGRRVSDFQQSLYDAGEQLIKLGLAIASLPLADQAAAAAQLGQSLDTLRGNLLAFLNSIIEISKSLSASIADARFKIKLDQAATPQDKSNLLMQQLRQQEQQINSAVANGLSPEDIQRLTSNALETINQIYALDPTARANWADAELANLDKIQKTALELIGKAAIAQFQAVVDAMQPVIDFFEGLGATAQPPVDALANAATGAAVALNNFTSSLREHGAVASTEPTPPGLPRKFDEGGPSGEVIPRAAAAAAAAPAAPAGVYVPKSAQAVAPTTGTTPSGGSAAPSDASQDAIIAQLKAMNGLMPAPEVYPAMYMDLEKLVDLAGGKTTDLQPDWNKTDTTDTGTPAADAATTADVMHDLAAAIANGTDVSKQKLEELVAGIDNNTTVGTDNSGSIAARLDAAIMLLAGILDEQRMANLMPPPPPEVRVVPVPTASGSAGYRAGAVTRRVNARI